LAIGTYCLELDSMAATVGARDDFHIADLALKHKDRFLVCTEPTYARYPEPGFGQWQADQIARDKQAGAVGLKVRKTLGLFLRENGRQGPLVKVDDPKFDPMCEAAGASHLPVLVHTADPGAFFLPPDRFNERYDGVYKHPNWSFYGQDFPSKSELPSSACMWPITPRTSMTSHQRRKPCVCKSLRAAIPHVKSMLSAIRRRDRATAAEHGKPAFAAM